MTKLFSTQVRDELIRTTKAGIFGAFDQFKHDMLAKVGLGGSSEAQAKAHPHIITKGLFSSAASVAGQGTEYILKPVINELSVLATGVTITVKTQVIIDK